MLVRCDHFKLALCLEFEGDEDRFAVSDLVWGFFPKRSADRSHRQ